MVRVGAPQNSQPLPAGWAAAPSLEAARDDGTVVRQGQFGPSVERIQQELVDGGYYDALPGGLRDDEVDGKFGARTHQALRAYQAAEGLEKVDGKVGPETYAAMFGDATTTRPIDAATPDLPDAVRDDVGEFVENQQNPGVVDEDTLNAGDLARNNPPPRPSGTIPAARPDATIDAKPAPTDGGVHERFAGDAQLERVAEGRLALRPGASGEHVEKVQNALIDLGFDIPTNGASGTYDSETAMAVRRFQRERGLDVDGVVGKNTLASLNEVAPPAGQQLERSPDYDRLYADGRLDTTIAIGYDEHGTVPRTTRGIVHGLQAQGFSPIDPSTMSTDERERLGLAGDRYDPNADYFHRVIEHEGREIDSVVRLIEPGDTARASFERAMEQDEVVIYTGHARYGSGPDFDHRTEGDGNFVISPNGNPAHSHVPSDIRNSIRDQPNGLRDVDGGPDYQLLIFNACSTENYMQNLRDPSIFSGRDRDNTDIIATTVPTLLATNSEHTLRFLSGIQDRESMNEILDDQNDIEVAKRQYFGHEWRPSQHTYTESGFLDNPGNRYVDRP
ncbi:MAG: peptidoglycan-binding protein [Deltaproteobacteria bacterium]